MNKKLISLVLGLVMLLTLAVPALAVNRNGVYILDEKEYLSDLEYQFYHNQAEALSDELDMDILYVQTYANDLQTDAQTLNLGSRENQIMLLDNDGYCEIALFGTAKALEQEHIQRLLDVYTLEPTYSEGIAAYLAVAEQIVTDLNASGAFQPQNNVPQGTSRLVDQADILDATEEERLIRRLDEISQRQQMDVVVVTVDSLGSKNVTAFADDFYDDNGYGFGNGRDGILLLISMAERDWCISTSGYGITAFTDAGQEYMIEAILPLLSEGEYAQAFKTFAEYCDDFITQAKNGEPFDVPNWIQKPFPFVKNLFICMIIGAVVALCVVLYMKSQLKSVRAQDSAAAYAKSAAPNLTVNREIYLYSTTTSRPKPKSDSSGGSSSHFSSSGRSHGGSSGKF